MSAVDDITQRLFDESVGIAALRCLPAPALLALELPELEVLLSPWLFQKTLAMVHAKRGVGKTHLALGVAYAVASGGTFLGWAAPQPRGVLYIDGEMPVQLMRRRLAEAAGAGNAAPHLLRLITPDLQDRPMPDLATREGQISYDRIVEDEDTALIIVDNLSSLVRSGGAENESESWSAVASWALKHRRAGRAVLFVHHSGKTGAQRGTSKREDLLDAVINLRRPTEHDEADGAVFTVHFEKSRSVTGEELAPIEARLERKPDGSQAWTWKSGALVTQEQIRALWDGGGLTLIDVAREAGVNKSYAHRTLKTMMDEGRLNRPYPAPRGKAAAKVVA